MSQELKDKVALVTGGANGIGAAVVRTFLVEGVKHVAFLDVDAKGGTELQSELRKEYGLQKATFYNCDVTSHDQLYGVFTSVIEEFGYIDVVVNNAGICKEDLEWFRKEIEVNVTAVAASTYKAMELMGKDKGGRGGVIMNVASIAAYMHFVYVPLYSATKAAVAMLSCCLGSELYHNKTAVRVMSICFGSTETAILHTAKSNDPEMTSGLQELIKNIPFQSAKSAAEALTHACKVGKSGSVWLSQKNLPAQDITELVSGPHVAISELF